MQLVYFWPPTGVALLPWPSGSPVGFDGNGPKARYDAATILLTWERLVYTFNSVSIILSL